MATDSSAQAMPTADDEQSRELAGAHEKTRKAPVSLLQLPDELLSDIVAHTAEPSHVSSLARLALVCKRLHPAVQQALYREINIGEKDVERLKLLTRTFLGRATTLALDYKLDVNLEVFNRAEKDRQPGASPSQTLTRSAAAFFDSLQFPQLRSLVLVSDSCSVLTDLLAAQLPSAAPNLQFLHVKARRSREDASAEWFSHLARMPRLKSLEVDGFEVKLVLPPDNIGVASLPQLESLRIPGAIVSPTASASLGRLAPNLRQLAVENGGTAALQHLLSGAPVGLKRLSIYDCADVAIEHFLNRFPQLELLHIGPGFIAERLLPLLASSRIAHLGFDCELPATDNLLLAIIDGPQRMPYLRSLTLLHADCEPVGQGLMRDLQDLDHATPDNIRAEVRSLHDKYKPNFQAGCTAAGLARVLQSATAKGIHVNGGALDCIDWNAKFDRQLERYFVERTVRARGSAVMERYYGRDQAAAVFSRLRPELANPFTDANV